MGTASKSRIWSIGLLVFSLAILVLKGGYPFSFTWFWCLGIVALSVSRIYGVRHPVPAPEFFIFAFGMSFKYLFQGLTYLKVPAFDETFYLFDRNYGYCEVLMMRLFHCSAFVFNAFRLVYLSLALVEVLLYLALPRSIRKLYAIGMALGVMIVPFYLVCPGAGPIYSMITHLNDLQVPPIIVHPQLRQLGNVALNACPSGHVTWALVMLWFCRKYKKSLQVVFGAFLVMTILATLGFGEHFVVDLVVAVPFAACIWSLIHKQWHFAIISTFTVLFWLVILRTGVALMMGPMISWILTGATVAFFSLHDDVRPRLKKSDSEDPK